MASERGDPATLFTVGHSNRFIEDFLALLSSAEIRTLVDVRRHPGSRRNPQFNSDRLCVALERSGIEYVWEGAALGGRRDPVSPTLHPELKVPMLKAYAVHMEGPEFQDAARRLATLAVKSRAAIMCAERLPEQCHRSLIADYLTLHGMRVVHLLENDRWIAHRLHRKVRVVDGLPSYDVGAQIDLEL